MAEYDEFAKEYQESKQLPFRTFAEQPLLLALLGDVKNLRVLDLGCGEGIYARRIMGMGAKKVVGVDLSGEMIALAQEAERTAPLGIEYSVGDAATIGHLGSFDLVIGSYILNYARSRTQLDAFCRTIRTNLKAGGRFVAMNDNPANLPQHYPAYRKYGFVKTTPVPRREGDPVTYTMYLEDGSTFSFDNFYLAPETYAAAFTACGFSEMRWHKPEVTPEGLQRYGTSFWREFLDDPPVIGIEAW